jgi:hypothetical protein
LARQQHPAENPVLFNVLKPNGKEVQKGDEKIRKKEL